MKVLIHPTRAAAVDCVAGLFCDRLKNPPEKKTVLGLATGGTMEAVYGRLIALYQAGSLSFAQAVSFNLDEYIGPGADHPCSYRYYMREKLFNHVDIDPARTFLPRGDAPDAAREAIRYEAEIVAAGGIDLQLLGLGRNGHIGFNEPTSSLSSLTRVKTLTRSTREANARFFETPDQVPGLAVTMGIGTIMRAREIVLLALGSGKADAVAGMVEGPVTAVCPASVLQMHPKVTLVADAGAASGLALRDYYQEVHPDGEPGAVRA